MKLGEKPRSLFCYICGREFGTNSLAIHLKKCPHKFQNQQFKKEPKDRRKCPDPPEELATILAGQYDDDFMEMYNQKAIKVHKYQSLAACRYCGRTFNEESLKAHENGCNKKDKIGNRISAPGNNSFQLHPENIKKPRVLQCCVCGREFGLGSLKIHYPKCQEKFKIFESQKPKAERKQCPEFSEEKLKQINSKEDWSEEEIEAFNNDANSNYRNNAMTQCDNCKRKFIAEAFEKHKKNCKMINGDKGGSDSKQKLGYDLPDTYKKPRTLTCCVCGREFGLTSLKIHYPQCIEKFKCEQSKKPKNERKAAPEFSQDQLEMVNCKDNWTSEQIEEFNKHANGNYRENGMTQCPNCKRKFFHESYLKHKKNCVLINGDKGSDSDRPSSEKSLRGSEQNQKKPRVLMCHICGRQFGLTSLLIHQKKCQIKFTNQEKKKPSGQRRPLPTFPADKLESFDLEDAEKWPIQKIEEYNSIANEVYRHESLSACPICGRKFFQQSLPKHFKYCQKNQEKQILRTDKNIKKTGEQSVFSQSNSVENLSKVVSPNKKIQSSLSEKKLTKKSSVNVLKNNSDSLSESNKSSMINPKHQPPHVIIEENNQSLLSSPEKESQIKKSFKNDKEKKFEIDLEENKVEYVDSNMEETFEPKKLKFDEQIVSDNEQDEDNCLEQPQKEVQGVQSDLMNSQVKKIDKQIDKELKIINKTDQNEQIKKFQEFQGKNQELRKSKGQKVLNSQKEEYKNSEKTMRPASKWVNTRVSSKSNINSLYDEESQKKSSNPIESENEGINDLKIEPKNEPRFKKQISIESDNTQKIASPKEKVRSSKGFAAPRKKQEEILNNMKECKVCSRNFPSQKIETHEQICIKNKEKNKRIAEQSKLQKKKSLEVEQDNNKEVSGSQNQFIRDAISPEDKVRMKKGFAAPRQKQIQIQSKMVECKGCKRKFIEERIEKHESICQKVDNKNKPFVVGSEKQISNIDVPEGDEKKSLVRVPCPHCGRKFAQERLLKHQQVCKSQKVKPTKGNEKQSAGQPSRKQLTKKQSQYSIDMEKIQAELESAKAISLTPCEKCGRNFNSQRLHKHQQVCKGKKIGENRIEEKKKPNNIKSEEKNIGYNLEKIQTDQAFGQQGKDDRVQCKQCHKKFAADRIDKHLNVCKVVPYDEKDLKNKTGSKWGVKPPVPPVGLEKRSQDRVIKNEKMITNPKIQLKSPKLNPIEKKEKHNSNKKQNESQFINDQYIEPTNLQQCPKCDRNFTTERLEKHTQICKGTNKLKKLPINKNQVLKDMSTVEKNQPTLNKIEKSMLNSEELRKTKDEFFNMMKDLKGKKIKEEQIDKDLEQELQSIARTNLIPKKKQNRDHPQIFASPSNQFETPTSCHKARTPRSSSRKKVVKSNEKGLFLPKI